MEPIICIQSSTPNYDALPTYKITHYPLEKRDYMPYAQARVCITPAHLEVQMWAFEAVPRPQSRLEAVFALPGGDGRLMAWVQADGAFGCTWQAEGVDKPLDCLAHNLEGEDLQGVFWGISLSLERELLTRELGKDVLHEGGILLGNFYKISHSPDKPHKGSMAPADFAGGQEYQQSSLTKFRVVRYE